MSSMPEEWLGIKIQDLLISPKQDMVDGPFGSNLKASEYVENGILVARLQNVQRGSFIFKNLKYVTYEKANDLSRHSFEKGDLLITKLGDPLGKACIVPEEIEKGIIVADIIRIRLEENYVNNQFLMFQINSDKVINQFTLLTKGTTRPRVNLTLTRNIDINLVPLAEQNEIASRLDLLLGEVEEIKARIDGIPAILKSFRQSVLAAAVNGKLTEEWRLNNKCHPNKILNSIRDKRSILSKKKETKDHKLEYSEIDFCIPMNWEVTPLGEITQYITSGSRGWSQYYSDNPEDAKFVRSAEINTNKLDIESAITVKLPSKVEGKRALIEYGDILITITGANVGKCAYIEEKIPEAYVSQSVALIKSIDHKISPFIHLWLLARNAGNKQLNDMIYGIGRPVLSLPNIYSIRIALPPLSEQIEIRKKVNNLFSLADSVEQKVQAAQEQVDKLSQSILAKAFRGELTREWREENFELISGKNSAEALLERIKNERKKTTPIKKKNPRGKIMNSKEEIIPIVDALREVEESLSSQELLQAAGYPNDSSTDQIEAFFLDIRESQKNGKIEKTRKGDTDYFQLSSGGK